ncbi:MAG: 30S ribosomal protein S20 [Candidatus Komeilibacteria bacterium]|nr:30S ribosomal protein S20 [Candidatus Komeilibacteria bacterium]
MPVKKAAIKDIRQSKKRTLQNLRVSREIKAIAKQVEKSLVAKEFDKLNDLSIKFQKAVDKAVKHGQMKLNTASRKKSRLAQQVKKGKVKE